MRYIERALYAHRAKSPGKQVKKVYTCRDTHPLVLLVVTRERTYNRGHEHPPPLVDEAAQGKNGRLSVD